MPDVAESHGLVPVPSFVESEVRAWTRPLVVAAGPSFRALYVYGSVLGPSFNAAASDVNVLLVVSDLDMPRLTALARALEDTSRGSSGRLRYSPVVLTEEQIRRSVDVFPLEFLDLTDARALLEGRDMLADVRVDRANLRHQCEYELRSKILGLRQAYLRAGGAEGTAHRLTAQAAGGSAALFRHLLTLRGERHPSDHREVALAVAAAYGVDAEGLDAPFATRRAQPPDEATAIERFARYVAALDALIAAVDDLPDSP